MRLVCYQAERECVVTGVGPSVVACYHRNSIQHDFVVANFLIDLSHIILHYVSRKL